jgi:hypothetical protein
MVVLGGIDTVSTPNLSHRYVAEICASAEPMVKGIWGFVWVFSTTALLVDERRSTLMVVLVQGQR